MTRFFSQYYRPSAGGSGIPELIGFLNGTVVRHIFNFKTMLVKFFSCVCAVGAGLPIGPEGPMIHLGYVAHMLFIFSNLSFDHIPKHQEEDWKCNAKQTIFNGIDFSLAELANEARNSEAHKV